MPDPNPKGNPVGETAKIVGGALLPDVPGISNPVGAAVDSAKAVGTFVAHLSDPAFWIRVGIGALGFFVIVVGLVIVLAKRVESLPRPPVVPVP